MAFINLFGLLIESLGMNSSKDIVTPFAATNLYRRRVMTYRKNVRRAQLSKSSAN